MEKEKSVIAKWFIFSFIISILLFYINIDKKRLQALIKSNEKNLLLYLLSTQWLYRKINGENIFMFLEKGGYNRIAVYGKNHSCECLCSELRNMGIEVVCIVDDKSNGRYGSIPIMKKDSMPKDVDAIIITNLVNGELIKKDLEDVYAKAVFTLEDIIKWG